MATTNDHSVDFETLASVQITNLLLYLVLGKKLFVNINLVKLHMTRKISMSVIHL